MTQHSSINSGSPVVFPQAWLFGGIYQGAWATGGTGADLAHLYQRKMDVLNRGLSGYNTPWAIPIARKLLGDAVHVDVKLVTIWLGANDAALPPSPQAVDLASFNENMRTLVSMFRKGCPHASMILIAPPPVDAEARRLDLHAREPPRVSDRDAEHTARYASAVAGLSKELDLHFVDAHGDITAAAAQSPDGLSHFLYDGLHLSSAGYAVVTQGVKRVITTRLPHLQWDAMEQIFPHWASIPNEGALGEEFRVETETPVQTLSS